MTFCYCLTTNGADEHAAMTLVSAISLRLQHPHARVVLAADAPSARALQQRQGHPLLGVVSELLPVRVPSETAHPGFRNRHVKTRLRSLVSGDFLYLDGDTVVREPLDEVFGLGVDFAGVSNHNSPCGVEPAFPHELAVFEAKGWRKPDGPYFNGGVLFFRDSDMAHRLGRLWHERWLETSAEGTHHDQPALNSAVTDSGARWELLADCFNAQVQARPSTARNARVWHIYGSLKGQSAPRSVLDEAVARCLAAGHLDKLYVQRLCQRAHPWTLQWPLDGWMVRRMMRQPGFLSVGASERRWLSGHRIQALRAYAARRCKELVARVKYRLALLYGRL